METLFEQVYGVQFKLPSNVDDFKVDDSFNDLLSILNINNFVDVSKFSSHYRVIYSQGNNSKVIELNPLKKLSMLDSMEGSKNCVSDLSVLVLNYFLGISINKEYCSSEKLNLIKRKLLFISSKLNILNENEETLLRENRNITISKHETIKTVNIISPKYLLYFLINYSAKNKVKISKDFFNRNNGNKENNPKIRIELNVNNLKLAISKLNTSLNNLNELNVIENISTLQKKSIIKTRDNLYNYLLEVGVPFTLFSKEITEINSIISKMKEELK